MNLLLDSLVGYCAQSTVSVSSEAAKMTLIKAGFNWKRLTNKVDTLSGGEKARLMLAALSRVNSHVLLLDEPTNHLDLVGKQQVAEQLQAYPGTLNLVSHDRHFIETICQRFLTIKDGLLHEFNDPKKVLAGPA